MGSHLLSYPFLCWHLNPFLKKILLNKQIEVKLIVISVGKLTTVPEFSSMVKGTTVPASQLVSHCYLKPQWMKTSFLKTPAPMYTVLITTKSRSLFLKEAEEGKGGKKKVAMYWAPTLSDTFVISFKWHNNTNEMRILLICYRWRDWDAKG